MTTFRLRTRSSESVPANGVLLDWFGRGGASTVSASVRDLLPSGETPHPLALDLLRLAVAVYGADKIALRKAEADRWTRSLEIQIAVSPVEQWAAAAERFEKALGFLTNDRWKVRIRREATTPGQGDQFFPADAVCLFSGGLDSLTGAINLLEDGQRVILVGHYDSNGLKPRQVGLFEKLRDHYGADRVSHRPFYLRLANANPHQVQPLPRGRESTTRSRSLLFIAAASLVASAQSLDRIHMPENGYIGLNIPLEPSRLGACSTRTTHPHFMSLLRQGFDSLGLALTIENPFRVQTKAEALRGCRNQQLLETLIEFSVSCAHPEVGRWAGAGYQNCGYCYPCLMRRVSLFAIGKDDPSRYRIDVGSTGFLSSGSTKADHLRALVANDARAVNASDALRSGPLPRGEAAEFTALYVRGREEISAWLDSAVPGLH